MRSALEDHASCRIPHFTEPCSILPTEHGFWCKPCPVLHPGLLKSSQAQNRLTFNQSGQAVIQHWRTLTGPVLCSSKNITREVMQIWPYKALPQAYITLIILFFSSHLSVKLALTCTYSILPWSIKIFLHVSRFKLTVFKGPVYISSLCMLRSSGTTALCKAIRILNVLCLLHSWLYILRKRIT